MDSRDEIVAKVRRSYEALSRGDFDAAVEIAHPDIEFVSPNGLTKLRGADKLRAWMEPDAFESASYEPLEFAVNDNSVLVRQRVRGRGAESGIELDIMSWAVWTLNEDAQAIRVVSFLDTQEAAARKAAGLSE